MTRRDLMKLVAMAVPGAPLLARMFQPSPHDLMVARLMAAKEEIARFVRDLRRWRATELAAWRDVVRRAERGDPEALDQLPQKARQLLASARGGMEDCRG